MVVASTPRLRRLPAPLSFQIARTRMSVGLSESIPATFCFAQLERQNRRASMRPNQSAAPVAQWIEHLPSKQRVAGSSPAGGANLVEPYDQKGCNSGELQPFQLIQANQSHWS